MSCQKFTPNQCCGCQVFENLLFPDFYRPTVTCMVRRRELSTIRTLTTQLTQTWIGGALTNNTATLVDETVETDNTIDTITQDLIAGQFEWVFPQSTEPFGPLAIESETGIPGVNATKVWKPRTQRTINRTVWEEYRLVFRYDVSNQFAFGLDDADGVAIIKAATASLTGDLYRITGWQPSGSTGQTHQVDVRGFLTDEDPPQDRDEFDVLWDAASNTATLSATLNILSWLPDTDSTSIYLLFYSDTEKRGMRVTNGLIRISDRLPMSSSAYDWTQDWTRESFTTWRTSAAMPTDNYQFSLASLLPASFWAKEDRRLTVTLFEEDEDGAETVFVEQIFEINIQPNTSYDPPRWDWTLESTGTFGTISHLKVTHTSGSFPHTNPNLFNGWAPVFKVRGSVIELTGGDRIEDGIKATYQFVPFWHGLDSIPTHYLRLEIESDNPQAGTYNETGLQHLEDEKKLTCPGNYTCSVTDDYAHPEWRVISHSLPGFNDTRLPVQAIHGACGVLLSGNPRTASLVVEYVRNVWQANWAIEYRYHQPYVFTRGLNCVFTDYVIVNATAYWPGSFSSAGSVGHSDNFVNDLANGKFYVYSGLVVGCSTDPPWLPENSTATLGPNLTSPPYANDSDIHLWDGIEGGDSVVRTEVTMDPIIQTRIEAGTFVEIESEVASIDVSSATWYNVYINHVEQGISIEGLPSEKPAIYWNSNSAYKGRRYYVTQGTGKGLVFELDSLQSFTLGTLIGGGPSRNPGTATFNWTFVRQASIPDLPAAPDEDAATQITDAIGSHPYLYRVNDELFRLQDGLTEGPLVEDDVAFTPSRQSRVLVEYTPTYHVGSIQITASVLDPVPYAGTSFGNMSDQDYDAVIAGPVLADRVVSRLYEIYTGPPTYTPGSGLFAFGYRLASDVMLGHFDNYEITTIESVIPDFPTPYSAYSMQVAFDTPYSGEYDFHEISATFSHRRWEMMAQIVAQQSRVFRYEKEVDRWKDRNLPTLTIDGGCLVAGFDFVEGSFVAPTFKKADNIEAIANNTSKDGKFELDVDETEVDAEDLELIIGPSTYVPPDTP
jgi:hypothetical protein